MRRSILSLLAAAALATAGCSVTLSAGGQSQTPMGPLARPSRLFSGSSARSGTSVPAPSSTTAAASATCSNGMETVPPDWTGRAVQVPGLCYALASNGSGSANFVCVSGGAACYSAMRSIIACVDGRLPATDATVWECAGVPGGTQGTASASVAAQPRGAAYGSIIACLMAGGLSQQEATQDAYDPQAHGALLDQCRAQAAG